MKLSRSTFLIVMTLESIFIFNTSTYGSKEKATIKPIRLNCEYRDKPQGMDILEPRLGWNLEVNSSKRGIRQTAYHILVASTEKLLDQDKGDIWNSGKVISNKTNQIVFQGKKMRSRLLCFWKVKIWDENNNESKWSDHSSWSMGLLQTSDWSAHWIGSNEGAVKGGYKPPVQRQRGTTEALPTPRYLRKEFESTKTIKRATLYVTALGLYEVHLNGRRLGNHLLAPEWTSYANRIQVDAIDVTKLINKGKNALGAILGNGWYCGNFQFWPTRNRIFGERPWFYCQLELETSDGLLQSITTDASWKVTTDGPIRQSGIYEGEIYNARNEMQGWDKVGFNHSAWQPVVIGDNLVQPGKFVWQRSEPIRITKELVPISINETSPGVYVYDLGQNIAGWARFTAKALAGTTITLHYAEALYPDGKLNREALRGAEATEKYTFRGEGDETFEPHFTYHGFRYIEVSGLSHPINVIGCVFHTDLAKVGSFRCSDSLVTKLAENIHWSLEANYMGIPTDCPNRDERTGVTGDHQFFMPTAIYNSNVASFFNKWLVDLCEDSQTKEGNFADIAPYYGMFEQYTQGWGDAGIICPYYQYKAYDDIRVIQDHYNAMKRHLEFVQKNSKAYLAYPIRKGSPGDWLNLGGSATKEVMGTAYFAWMTGMMAEMAEAIGKTQDAEEYRDLENHIKAAFISNFIKADGSLDKCSQTGYAMAFNIGLVPDTLKEKMALKFAEEVKRFNYHPTVGFMGVPHLLPGLHKAGLDQDAYRLLLQQSFPSWLYMIKAGNATTIWERWDTWTPEKGYIPDDMKSMNHVVWGSMGEYLFREVGGIRPMSPGFKTIQISPISGDGIDWAETSYQSINGLIKTSWKKTETTFELYVEVPPNTSAEIILPNSNHAVITENGKPVLQSKNIVPLNSVNGNSCFQISSGSYNFKVKK